MRVLIVVFNMRGHPRAEGMVPRYSQVGAMSYGLVSAPTKLTRINGASMPGSSQGSGTRYLVMAETFLWLCLQFGCRSGELVVQVGVEEGSSEGRIPTLESFPCYIHAVCDQSTRVHLKVEVGTQNHRGIILCDTLSGRRRHQAFQFHSGNSMAPCGGYRRPRRGGNSGQSRTRDSSQSSPRRITPLACASPPSGDSASSAADLNNEVQTATLYYRRKRDKPVVKAMITVIFAEEDEAEESWQADMEEKTPPSSDNNSKIKDSSCSLEPQSKMDEDSTYGYSAEQAEALQEITILKGKEPVVSPEGLPEALKEAQIDQPPSP